METKRLYRSKSNRVITGVAGGIAEYFDIDPIIIRVIFVVLALTNGIGFLAYFIAWIAIPEHPEHATTHTAHKAPDTEEKIEAAAEQIVQNLGTGNRWMGVVLIGIGVLFLIHNIFPFFLDFARLWPVLVIILGGYVLIGSRKG